MTKIKKIKSQTNNDETTESDRINMFYVSNIMSSQNNAVMKEIATNKLYFNLNSPWRLQFNFTFFPGFKLDG